MPHDIIDNRSILPFLIEEIASLEREKRFILLGKTRRERLLFIVFTIREKSIRVISARDVNRKERPLYEERN